MAIGVNPGWSHGPIRMRLLYYLWAFVGDLQSFPNLALKSKGGKRLGKCFELALKSIVVWNDYGEMLYSHCMFKYGNTNDINLTAAIL